ncbi:hypothetical protein [Peptoniphilus porci]|uniref:Uncharacterized protein n=1 Tax=Peptoniphilus porci TaxID=2652280 RepID=A0A1U7M012_9FIRM|nr:hypothetical protein [Peptoniphilus porci]OLR65005.1 hypothetical protein BIV18_05495 [Peptoniphilus porci]
MDLKNNCLIIKDRNKVILFIVLIALLNFVLLPIDSYLQNNYIYKVLNLKDKESLTLESKKTFYLPNVSDEINIFEYNVKDKKIYDSLDFDNKDLDAFKKDKNFMLILSHLNLQSFLKNDLPKDSITTLLFFNRRLNSNNYYIKDLKGWDFIIIDKYKNKITLVNYVKSSFTLS